MNILKGYEGMTLIELAVTVSIIAILLLAVGFEFQGWMGSYRIESQVKEVQSDLMNARMRAMQRNRTHFVVLTANNYQMYEDTNENNTLELAGDAKIWTNPKTLKYRSFAAGTTIFDTKGLVSTNPPTPPGTDTTLRFDIGTNNPDYDCINLSPTRINIGKWDGVNCVEK